MRRKNVYIANEADAICSDCGLECSPVYDSGLFDFEYGSIKGTHSDGETWESDCCSASMLDICGGEWVADVQEGCPEP